MAMKIVKRQSIDDSIYDELVKKHPVKSEKGVCYVQDMDYITVEVEEFNNPVFRKIIKQDSKALIVYMYLRERMCHSGWYVTWDNDTKEDIIERLTLWGVSENESTSIINLLIEKQLIKIFRYDNAEHLTDVQQIYNWEMLQAKRARDRKSKQSKAEESSINNAPVENSGGGYQPPPDIPQNDYCEQMSDGFSLDDDLPFN